MHYDGMGRLASVQDSTGLSSFACDSYGLCTNEVTPFANIERYHDVFGRDVGYAHSSGTIATNVYDRSTGRLSQTSFDGIVFSYGYVPGTDLEARISAPGFDKVVRYEARRDIVAEIAYTNSGLMASRSYEYDAAGNIIRRVQRRGGWLDRQDDLCCDSRGQLTNAVLGSANYSYCFDDAGNRTRAVELGIALEYQANCLNQYACITNGETGSWRPLYDVDGNQTLAKTKTGVWTVIYDGENRPVLWSCGTTTVLLTYDWAGRCVGKKVLDGDVVRKESRFAYNGGVRVAEYAVSGGQTSLVSRVYWDPSQSEATRPLAMVNAFGQQFYCTVDITKNVCEMLVSNGEIVQTYDYAPFGNVAVGSGDFASLLQWSSEFFDEDVGVVSYLSRNYDPSTGRWLSRDPLLQDGYNLYLYVRNQPMLRADALGLAMTKTDCDKAKDSLLKGDSSWGKRARRLIDAIRSEANCTPPTIRCDCCKKKWDGSFGGSTLDGSGIVTICHNNQDDAFLQRLHETVVHELIHAYDSCKGNDRSTCEKIACTEIHAARLSGECMWGGLSRRVNRGLPLRTLGGDVIYPYEPEEQCIKRSAKESLKAHRKCSLEAAQYIENAYEHCADDIAPFENPIPIHAEVYNDGQ